VVCFDRSSAWFKSVSWDATKHSDFCRVKVDDSSPPLPDHRPRSTNGFGPGSGSSTRRATVSTSPLRENVAAIFGGGFDFAGLDAFHCR